jgi:hypothetical protein
MDTVPCLSGIASMSGGGNVLKPIVIHKNLENAGNLSDLEPLYLFVTSHNGWVTKDLWI